MGNEVCCQDTRERQDYFGQVPPSTLEPHPVSSANSHFHLSVPHVEEPTPHVPINSPAITNLLNEHRPFSTELAAAKDVKTKQFGADVYVGPIDQAGRPDGYGKMYKSDGSLFVGQFENGVANGKGFYAMQDGSYYKGEMAKNCANCENGEYSKKDYLYRGGFQDNMQNGKGKELAKEYAFLGSFNEGVKTEGTLKWGKNLEEYEYTGKFDHNGKYAGDAKLRTPEGTYVGGFLHGEKHGHGVYTARNGIVYEGEYRKNMKEGSGILKKHNGVVLFNGRFSANVPTGQGKSTDEKGITHDILWDSSLNADLLK